MENKINEKADKTSRKESSNNSILTTIISNVKDFLFKIFKKIDRNKKGFLILITIISIILLGIAFLIRHIDKTSIKAGDIVSISNNDFDLVVDIKNNYKFSNSYEVYNTTEDNAFNKIDPFKPVVYTKRQMNGDFINGYVLNAVIPKINIKQSLGILDITDQINNLENRIDSKTRVNNVNDPNFKKQIEFNYVSSTYNNILSIALKYSDDDGELLKVYNYDARKNASITFKDYIERRGMSFDTIDNIVKKMMNAKGFDKIVSNVSYSKDIYNNYIIDEDGNVLVLLNKEDYIKIKINKKS